MSEKKSTPYFGEEVEKKLVEYLKETDSEKKNEIYAKYLRKPMDRLVSGCVWKYHTFIPKDMTIKDCERDTLSHIIFNMKTFSPERGHKAYSYLNTIGKNYIINLGKNSYKYETRSDSFGEVHISFLESKTEFQYEIDDDLDVEVEEESLANKVINNMIEVLEKELVENQMLRHNDIIVGDALINVLKNSEYLFANMTGDNKPSKTYNKAKFMLLMREQTNLRSDEIRASMQHFKSLYKTSKNDLITKLF